MVDVPVAFAHSIQMVDLPMHIRYYQIFPLNHIPQLAMILDTHLHDRMRLVDTYPMLRQDP
jgi:hypothetical protein